MAGVDTELRSLSMESAFLYRDVQKIATTTNTTPWFCGSIGERLLQKWNYKHAG